MTRPLAAALLFASAVAAPAPAAAQTTLKLATLAPEGSSWMKLFHEWKGAVEKRTEGRVKIRFYAGGVQGDERDVLRKIRLGQLSGAAVTAIGLAAIDPEVRALEVAKTYEELDFARAGLREHLRRKFDDKGFILLGWGDVGPVHIFSKKPLRTMDDLRSLKLWLFSDDPTTREVFTALGLTGVPMGIPDVLPALATGVIDAFFSAPLPTLALQWSSHVRYCTSLIIGQATGATVVAKKAWETLAPADQAAIREESEKLESRVIAQVRADNTATLRILQQQGMKVDPTPPALAEEMARRTRPVVDAAGQKMSAEFKAEVRKLLEQYRARR